MGGPYFVGGSLASSLQGKPRATNDIDVIVRSPLAKLRAFADARGKDFEVDADMVRGGGGALRRERVLEAAGRRGALERSPTSVHKVAVTLDRVCEPRVVDVPDDPVTSTP